MLALAGPAGIARASIATHLFDDHQNPEASLNVLLSRLRTALAAHSALPLLQSTGHRLHLSNVDADVYRLLNALTQHQPLTQSIESALSVLDSQSTNDLVPGSYSSGLIAGLREDLCVRMLATFASWVQSPHVERWRPQLLHAVTLIQRHLPFNGITVERLLLIFGALGLKELLLKTYDDYESFLETEFGERTPRSVESLVENLIVALDEQHRQSNQFPNFDLYTVYGREAELRHLASVSQMPGVHVVAGHSGIGKSTLLQSFSVSASLVGLKRSWIDLAYEDEEKAFASLLSQGPDFIFIDHYTQRNSAFVTRVRHALGTAKIFVVGVSPAKISATTILMLQPLPSHPDPTLDPALQLFLDRVEKYGAGPFEVTPECLEIVHLSEGIPYVIDMLARLTATAGPIVGRELLERWRTTETPDQVESMWPSLMIATRASIAALSVEGQTALALLARLDSPMSTNLMIEAGSLSTDVLEELIASGLIRSEDAGASVQTHGISANAIRFGTNGVVSDASFAGFVGDLARCLLKRPDQMLATTDPSRLTAQMLVNRLATTDLGLGIRLLEEVRHLLMAGSTVLLDEEALRIYVESNEITEEQFGIAVLGYGAFLFSRTRYDEMLAFLERRATDPRMLLLSDERCANVLSQRALALRCCNRNDEALLLFQAALERARIGGNKRTIAKVSYNIAMLYLQIGKPASEGIAHLDEAINLLAFTPNQAAKVELLHMRALLMNEAGFSFEKVIDELRSALCQAAQFHLPMQVAWVAQNMGLVYAKHGQADRAVVCESSAVFLAVGLPEGLGKESLRLIRSSLGTLGACLQDLGHFHHGVTCRTLMDRVAVYETFRFPLNEQLIESLKSRTYQGTVTWEEFPVTADEIRGLCGRYFEDVTTDAPELRNFFKELDALSGGHLGKMTAVS